MKLATYKSTRRDGRLMIVSRDLARCTPALAAPTLQAALDDWAMIAPKLEAEYAALMADAGAGQAFDPVLCHSPLPRAYQWADGSAYVNHVALVRKARGAEMPESFWTDPLMYQGGSDSFLAPMDDIPHQDPSFGLDLEGEVAVITDDVPLGATVDQAAAAIRLVMLVNDVSLRGLIPDELAKGFGFFQSKPASSFSPVAVTPDELAPQWQDNRLHGVLQVDLNGKPFGRADAGVDMVFDFATLVAHAARTRALVAGSIIGSGTVSNRDIDGGPGKPVDMGGRGYSCLAEVRMVETILDGAARTPFLKPGDEVVIDMKNAAGQSIFGSIKQRVVAWREKQENGEKYEARRHAV